MAIEYHGKEHFVADAYYNQQRATKENKTAEEIF